ncbi:hypothetical protein [Sphingobium sp. Cam5-1]|uniref:hypothetical protein n=1 Tax=Sphingobium sp. Cam5-1 TaxID=2789327 RepID=UPI0018AD2BBF|nr:hypothetical protein [Sphingobium sp. Cam5-1]QPI74466.1 hypothetical protein IZV00_16325 [Sphingobium sp. Cam5-1]
MSVLVEFPGGVCREVPSQLRAIGPRQNGAPEFEQVPLNCDSHWKFEREDGRWIAVRRQGQLLALRPATPAWWHFVALMMEPERLPRAAGIEDQGVEAGLQSAA